MSFYPEAGSGPLKHASSNGSTQAAGSSEDMLAQILAGIGNMQREVSSRACELSVAPLLTHAAASLRRLPACTCGWIS